MSWAAKSRTPPPGYAYGPTYRASLLDMARAIIYIARGRPRSLAHDALWAEADMPVAPLARGVDLIPERGPFVVVANHYERPGLWMAWPALYISHLIQERTGQDTHWIAIEEWETFSFAGIAIPSEIIRRVFERAFGTYGIVAMPPPDAPSAARATAMRRAAREMRSGQILGLMPEGTVGPTPELLPAREGVGGFLQLLTAGGAPVLPCGIYEESGRLVAHFGRPFKLEHLRGRSREEQDADIRRQVMLAIREMVPETLWGAYRELEVDADEKGRPERAPGALERVPMDPEAARTGP